MSGLPSRQIPIELIMIVFFEFRTTLIEEDMVVLFCFGFYFIERRRKLALNHSFPSLFSPSLFNDLIFLLRGLKRNALLFHKLIKSVHVCSVQRNRFISAIISSQRETKNKHGCLAANFFVLIR